jgi:hypothetical protein
MVVLADIDAELLDCIIDWVQVCLQTTGSEDGLSCQHCERRAWSDFAMAE